MAETIVAGVDRFIAEIEKAGGASEDLLKALRLLLYDHKDETPDDEAHAKLLELRKILEEQEESKETLHSLGLLSYFIRDYDQSSSLYARLVDCHNVDEHWTANYIYILIEAGQTRRAVEALKSASLDFKTSANAGKLAQKMRDAGCFSEALEMYEIHVEVTEGNIKSWCLVNIAWLHEQLRDSCQAKTKYKEALDICPQDAFALMRLGNIEAGDGDYEAAEAHCRAALEADKSIKESYLLMGWIHNRQKRYREAIGPLAHYFEMTGHIKALGELGYSYYELHEDNLASQILSCYIQKGGASAWSYRTLGYCLYRLERFDESIAALLKSLELEPDDAYALEWLGDAYSNIEEYPQAIEIYNKLLKVAPATAEILNNLGDAHMQCDEVETAQRCYSEAVQLEPSHVGARMGLALTLLAMDDMIGYELERDLIKDLDPEAYAYLKECGQDRTDEFDED